MGRISVLDELEAIGALGDAPSPAAQRVEDVALEAGSPTARLRDERGPLMVEVCDRIADKLDRLTENLDGTAKMLQDLKGEILEMKRIWQPPTVEEVEDAVEDNPPEEDDGEVHETP